MEEHQKLHLEQWENVLRVFLSPLSVSERMEDFKEVHEQLQREEDIKKHATIFIKALKESKHARIYKQFEDALRECNGQDWLYEFMFGKSDENLGKYIRHTENIEKIKRILHIIKPQSHYIQIDELLNCMENHFTDEERSEIRATIERKGNIFGLWKFLSTVENKDPDWISSFRNYLKESNLNASDRSEKLLFDIFENYFENETLNEALPKPYIEMNLHGSALKEEVTIENLESSPKQTHSSKPFEIKVASQEDNNACCSSINRSQPSTSGIKPDLPVANSPAENKEEEFSLYEYQKDLVETAISSDNAIICAPPGSGKTLIAAKVIKHFKDGLPQNFQKSGCKILFFAPTIGLVTQQCEKIQTYLGESYRVGCMHGQVEDNVEYQLTSYDVLCSTPQIFLNALTKEKTEISLTNFALLVFDECHHCDSKQPYLYIMKMYIRLKNRPTQNLPRILGLTATLGAGSKTSLSSVESNIELLCANMDAIDGIVSIGEKHRDELSRHVAQPEERTIPAKENNTGQFFLQICLLMDEYIKMIRDLQVYSEFAESGPNLRDLSCLPKEKNIFEQHIYILKQLLEGSTTESFPNARDALACIDYLLVCHRSLAVLRKCQPYESVQFLRNFVTQTRDNFPQNPTVIEKKLIKTLEDKMPDLKELSKLSDSQNENYEIIRETIIQQFAVNNDSRVMVMVEERRQTAALKRWMNTKDELKHLNPEVFVGTKSSNSLNMSAEDQIFILEAFRDGRHKVLACTAEAAGEGIDVVACNLVIKFDFSHSEISMIQTRGRVRKIGGRVLQISSESVKEHEKLNLFKELLMQKAALNVQKRFKSDKDQYLKTLKELQEKAEVDFQLELAKKFSRQRNIDDSKEYHLQCKRCKELICSSKDIRVIHNSDMHLHHSGKYTNLTAEFMGKCKVTPHPRMKKMGPDWMKKAKLPCVECGNMLGTQGEWQSSISIPLLKCDAFKVVDPAYSEFFQLPRRWMNVCFNISPMTLAELSEIAHSAQETEDK